LISQKIHPLRQPLGIFNINNLNPIEKVMKKIFLSILVVLTLFVPVNAQQDKQDLYQHKVEVYTRMKNAGWTMTGFGGGLIVTGTILVATLPGNYWGYEDYSYSYYDDPYDGSADVRAFGGFMCIGLGVGLLAGGITMGSIGTHKLRQYKSKLDNLSFVPVITPKVQGFSLVYRF
jgi:hypothetical protein